MGFAGVFFSVGLIPQVVKGFLREEGAVVPFTAGLTAAGLFAICLAQWTLNLPFAATISFVSASLWSVLLYQALRYGVR